MNNAMKYAIASATPKSMMRKQQPTPSLEPVTPPDVWWGDMIAAIALAGTVIIALVGFWS